MEAQRQKARGARKETNYMGADANVLDQAVKTDNDNPVYYVQYAHARICSILKKMESEGVQFAGAEKVDATPVSYTHLDVYKRQVLGDGSLLPSWSRVPSTSKKAIFIIRSPSVYELSLIHI